MEEQQTDQQADDIRKATVRIVAAYISHQQVPAADIPALITAVGAALLPQAMPQTENLITKPRRRVVVLEPDLVPEEPPVAPPINESDPKPRSRGRRSARALIVEQAEVVVEEGVRITRLPPVVKRKRG